ncbi:NEDD4-binding protein 2 [Mactra antiquata]
MPRSRNSRSASPQKPVSHDRSEIERRKTYQNVHDIFCEAIDDDVIKLVLQECDWKEEESIEKLLVIAESHEEQTKYKSKLHAIAEGIFGSLRSEDYVNPNATSTLSPSEKVIRRPGKSSSVENGKNIDHVHDAMVAQGFQSNAYFTQSKSSEKMVSVDEIEMHVNFPQLKSQFQENVSSTSSSVNSQRSFKEVTKKPVSSKNALLSQAQSAFNQQFDDAEGTQRWEECKDRLSEHYLTNFRDGSSVGLKSSPFVGSKQSSVSSILPDDPAILQAELSRPVSKPHYVIQDVEKHRTESGRSFPVRLLSRSPDSLNEMKSTPTSTISHGLVKKSVPEDIVKGSGDLDETVLKCIYEINGDLLDVKEIENTSTVQTEDLSTFPSSNIDSKYNNEPMTLPTIGLSVNAAEFVPRPKPVVTSSPTEVVNAPSPEPTSRRKRSNSVEIKAGVKTHNITSPTIPLGSPLTISPALSPGLSPQSTQMNSPVANLTGSPMFITPKWPQVHSGMPQLQHVVIAPAPPQRFMHQPPTHHISTPGFAYPPTPSVPYSTRVIYNVAPPPLFRAAGVSPYVPQSSMQHNLEDRAAVATGQPIMATSESTQLGQSTAALNTVNQVKNPISPIEQKVEKVKLLHRSGIKVLIIIRGLPGSGKSTLARALKLNGVILSTDDYFMKGKKYEYHHEKITEAHTWNKERAKEAMKIDKSPIIIDNTNTMIWEFKPYINMGLNHNYHVEIFEPDTPWKMKPSELARRNTHGVPLEQIKRMMHRYEQNINLDSLLKKNNTSNPKANAASEDLLLSALSGFDEKLAYIQGDPTSPPVKFTDSRSVRDGRFHAVHKVDEFRKQKSGESDSDSISSLPSGSLSSQSSSNASPKPLRSSLKTPGTMQKLDKAKSGMAGTLLSIKPTVRKVKRKAMKQIETKLSSSTLNEVNEMVKEHVNGKVLSVEDVSKTEEELKALLQFCAIDDSELVLAEELISLKLHDAIHQSFEGPETNNDTEENDSDNEKSDRHKDDDSKVSKSLTSDLIESAVSGQRETIELVTEPKIDEVECVGNVGKDIDGVECVGNMGMDSVKDGFDYSNSSHKKNTDAISVDSESNNEDSHHDDDAPVCQKSIEAVSIENVKLDKKEHDFEMKYWGGTDVNEEDSNSINVENEWEIGVRNEWEDTPGVRVKPQRSRKSCLVAMETNNNSLEDDSIIKVVHAESNEPCNNDDNNVVDDNDANLKGDITETDEVACSEGNLISDKSDKSDGKSDDITISSDNKNGNLEENNLFLSENSVSVSGSKCDNSSCVVQPPVEINSSLKLLKDSYNDNENSYNSSMNSKDCDNDVDSSTVQDFDVDSIDVKVDNEQTECRKLEANIVNEDASYVLEDETENSPDQKSDQTLQDGGVKNIKSTPDSPSDKVEAGGTPKKKSSKRNGKKIVPFLNSADKKLFKTANWSSFPLISGETASVSSNGKDVITDKVMNTVGTMTSIEYFNIVSSLNQGGFIDSDIKYITGNPKTLARSFTIDSSRQKVSNGPTEVCYVEKSTMTADLVTEDDADGLEFLRTCFPAVADDELECVLEICSNNVTWAINLLLDWKYNSELTEDDKKKFSVKLSEIQKDDNLINVQAEDTKKGPGSLLDLCIAFIENENIGNRADIENQLIKTCKDRLDTIENDNRWKIKFGRSLSTGDSPVDKSKSKDVSDKSKNLLRLNSAEPVVNLPEKEVQLLDDMSAPTVESEKVYNDHDDHETEDTKVSDKQDGIDGGISDQTVSSTIDTDTDTKWSMIMDMEPEFIMQLEDMFGSLDRHTNVNSKMCVPIDRKTAWLLYQCVKNCLASSNNNHLQNQLLKDEEYARKLQNEENSYRKQESSQRSNGSRSRRGVPLLDYSVKGTIPSSPIKPVAWTHGKQSLAEIMKEQQTIQDKQDAFQKLIENEGAHSVMSTRLKRQKLYEAFPKVDKTQLDEIFQACCFNLTETVEAVTTSLGEGPIVSSTSVIDQESIVNDQKLLEATKQRSVEDMLNQYNHHGDVASKDYQDGVDPEYEDYRGEANLHHRLRQECFMKAREAYRRGLKQVASFYSQQGHQHTQKLKEANMRASNQILAERNYDIEKNMTLDLHGLHIDEVREALNRIIAQKERDRCKQLTVITGRGSHSKGGVAKLRPYVIDYLNKNKYNYTEVSIGVFKVSLKYRSPEI